jgi:hypothetical protein
LKSLDLSFFKFETLFLGRYHTNTTLFSDSQRLSATLSDSQRLSATLSDPQRLSAMDPCNLNLLVPGLCYGHLVCKTPEVEDDLLIQQLHEWAQIEDDYDQIPWTITDPGEEEHIFDKLDEAIHRHTAHARAGPPTSTGKADLCDMYLTRRGLDKFGMPLFPCDTFSDVLVCGDGYDYGWGWKHWDPSSICWPEDHIFNKLPGLMRRCVTSSRPQCLYGEIYESEDNEGRIIVRGVMTNKGMNYMKATTPYGDCYINLKFTSYVPEIGEPLKMICRFQEPKMNIPMKCIKVV